MRTSDFMVDWISTHERDAAKAKAKLHGFAVDFVHEVPVLIDMGENVITREIAAGLVPEEFRDGPVWHSRMKGGR